MSFWDIFRQQSDVKIDTSGSSDQVPPTGPAAFKHQVRLGTTVRQERQIAAIRKAEIELKDNPEALIEFWENLLTKDGILFNGVGWPFKIIELYYKVGRYNDAWFVLNSLALNPLYTKKVRRWQIKILKKEKKDYSRIQQLLDDILEKEKEDYLHIRQLIDNDQ